MAVTASGISIFCSSATATGTRTRTRTRTSACIIRSNYCNCNSALLALPLRFKFPCPSRAAAVVSAASASIIHTNNLWPRLRNGDGSSSSSSIISRRGRDNVCALSTSSGSGNGNGNVNEIEVSAEMLSRIFPLCVSAAAAVALVRPSIFSGFSGPWQIAGLTFTMLGMGMTLSLKDLQAAFSMPKEILGGVVLQYTVMPTAGALISRLLKLPSDYAAGLILLACCPGGTASNVVTYMARGNVALSVLMTAASTFLAVIMTPFLTAKLAGQFVAVDAKSLFLSTLQVVLIPVLAGTLLNQFIPQFVRKVSPITPIVAVVAVTALIGSAISQNASVILSSGGQVILAVCLLHACGYFFGYLLSKILGFNTSSSRTISIEVGMQNSVLGVVLAGQHFSSPLTAVPSAVSSVCQSIIGSALAGFWRLSSSNYKSDD